MKFSRKICGCSKMVLAAVVVFTSLSLSAARHYYVNADPTKASDDYDGSAPEWAGGDSKIGPKLTLQGAMSISELDSGDTVNSTPEIRFMRQQVCMIAAESSSPTEPPIGWPSKAVLC